MMKSLTLKATGMHPYFTDDELWDCLSSVSVSVLPYRFGTHSGWLEACFDLGTAAVVPTCGFYSEQRPCEVFDFTEESFDPCSLHRAVRTAYDWWAAGIETPRARWSQRRTERVRTARAHRDIYEAAPPMSEPHLIKGARVVAFSGNSSEEDIGHRHRGCIIARPVGRQGFRNGCDHQRSLKLPIVDHAMRGVELAPSDSTSNHGAD
jgi:hypothetical protein